MEESDENKESGSSTKNGGVIDIDWTKIESLKVEDD